MTITPSLGMSHSEEPRDAKPVQFCNFGVLQHHDQTGPIWAVIENKQIQIEVRKNWSRRMF